MGGAAVITKDQFIRGMDEIGAYLAMKDAITEIASNFGVKDIQIGLGDTLLDELVRQLCERCLDPQGDNSLIEYFLYEQPGRIVLDDGRSFTIEEPEHLWSYWAASKTGPFQELVA